MLVWKTEISKHQMIKKCALNNDFLSKTTPDGNLNLKGIVSVYQPFLVQGTLFDQKLLAAPLHW